MTHRDDANPNLPIGRVYFDANDWTGEKRYLLKLERSLADLSTLGEGLANGSIVTLYDSDGGEVEARLAHSVDWDCWTGEPIGVWRFQRYHVSADDVLAEFRAAGALREGHFVLSSGLHSPVFLQKNLVFMRPDRCERLCRGLAARIVDTVGPVDVAISPAVGGIIPGYETARHLGVRSLYVEREGGEFKLRRGFSIEPGEKVVMVEDIVTTGVSSRECIESIRRAGGDVVAAACIVDRSGGRADVGVPLIALATLDVPAYAADALPPELAALPIEDPGSRRLSGG